MNEQLRLEAIGIRDRVEATTNKDENNGELSLTDWQRFFDNIQFNINEILTFWDADNERNGLSDYHKEIISKLRERLPDFDAYLIEHGDNSQTLSKMIEAMREVANRCPVDIDFIRNGFVSWGNNSNDAIALSEQCNRWLRTYDLHINVGASTPPQETPSRKPVVIPKEIITLFFDENGLPCMKLAQNYYNFCVRLTDKNKDDLIINKYNEYVEEGRASTEHGHKAMIYNWLKGIISLSARQFRDKLK
jgi:hypothetical protein